MSRKIALKLIIFGLIPTSVEDQYAVKSVLIPASRESMLDKIGIDVINGRD